MSTDVGTRRARRRRRERGRFGRAFALTVAGILAAAAVGAALTLTQGPRASAVVVDTQAVAEASGQRLVFTLNQTLDPVEQEQVTVTPAAAFTVVTSGRHVAVQFTHPLTADTDYVVTIADVVGASGGPTATLRHEFRTADPPLYLLQRHTSGDAVFASNLVGDEAVPVYSAPHIEDFRAARSGLVVTTADDSGNASLEALDLDTGEVAPLRLPGTGTVSALQTADHGGLVGYTFTDEAVGRDGALDSALFIASLDEPDAAPRHIAVGEDPRVQRWAFVPQTSYLLVLAFDGQLRLVDTEALDADPITLGTALSIAGIEHGTGRAIVERFEGFAVIDLTTLAEEPLVTPPAVAELGYPAAVVPTADGATLRTFALIDDSGMPVGQRVVRVTADGAVSDVYVDDDPGDVVLQVCGSPSGRYAAVLVAPDLVSNPYDRYFRPLPERLETHIVDMEDAAGVSVLQGSDISWCAWAP